MTEHYNQLHGADIICLALALLTPGTYDRLATPYGKIRQTQVDFHSNPQPDQSLGSTDDETRKGLINLAANQLSAEVIDHVCRKEPACNYKHVAHH